MQYRVLLFGDSNTWGFDAHSLTPGASFVKRMAAEVRWPGVAGAILGERYAITENALNGRTIIVKDPYHDFRPGIETLPEAMDAGSHYDLVVLHLGVNELKDYMALSAGMIANGMERLVKAAQQSFYGCPPAKVLLIAPPPTQAEISSLKYADRFGAAYEKSVALAPLYRAVAQRNGCGFLDCTELNFRLNDIDGFHYCEEDHKKLGVAAAEAIKALLP